MTKRTSCSHQETLVDFCPDCEQRVGIPTADHETREAQNLERFDVLDPDNQAALYRGCMFEFVAWRESRLVELADHEQIVSVGVGL